MLSPAPGALLVQSDAVRKKLWGSNFDQRLPKEAYSLEFGERTYKEVRMQADAALRNGHAVIVDAVHARPEERAAFADVAKARGVPFAGLWLEVPQHVVLRRVAGRQNDISDATTEVLSHQLNYDLGEIDW